MQQARGKPGVIFMPGGDEVKEFESETVRPIKNTCQPYFRKHYRPEYSCQCGRKLEKQWLYCPYCGKTISWDD